jgi:hypothetical protein
MAPRLSAADQFLKQNILILFWNNPNGIPPNHIIYFTYTKNLLTNRLIWAKHKNKLCSWNKEITLVLSTFGVDFVSKCISVGVFCTVNLFLQIPARCGRWKNSAISLPPPFIWISNQNGWWRKHPHPCV